MKHTEAACPHCTNGEIDVSGYGDLDTCQECRGSGRGDKFAARLSAPDAPTWSDYRNGDKTAALAAQPAANADLLRFNLDPKTHGLQIDADGPLVLWSDVVKQTTYAQPAALPKSAEPAMDALKSVRAIVDGLVGAEKATEVFDAISEALPIYEDVYDQCCEAIKPLVDAGRLPGSVVDSVGILVAAFTGAQPAAQELVAWSTTYPAEWLEFARALKVKSAQPTEQGDAKDANFELPVISTEDRQFLHDNPNTNDLVKWVQDYARAAILASAKGTTK